MIVFILFCKLPKFAGIKLLAYSEILLSQGTLPVNYRLNILCRSFGLTEYNFVKICLSLRTSAEGVLLLPFVFIL